MAYWSDVAYLEACDPGKITGNAEEYKRLTPIIDQAMHELDQVKATTEWESTFRELLDKRLDETKTAFRELRDGFDRAGKTLEDFAPEIRKAKQRVTDGDQLGKQLITLISPYISMLDHIEVDPLRTWEDISQRPGWLSWLTGTEIDDGTRAEANRLAGQIHDAYDDAKRIAETARGACVAGLQAAYKALPDLRTDAKLTEQITKGIGALQKEVDGAGSRGPGGPGGPGPGGTGGTPPVGTPPVGTSPVGTSPVGTSPVGTSPVGTSPVGTSPVGTSPVGTPPVGTSPVGTSPVGTPPVGTPPVGTSPVGTPPVGTPPVGTSPVDTSPSGINLGRTLVGDALPSDTSPSGINLGETLPGDNLPSGINLGETLPSETSPGGIPSSGIPPGDPAGIALGGLVGTTPGDPGQPGALASFGNAMLHHPLEMAATVGGIGLAAVGGVVAAAGKHDDEDDDEHGDVGDDVGLGSSDQR